MFTALLSDQGKNVFRSQDLRWGFGLAACLCVPLAFITGRGALVSSLAALYLGVLGALFSVVIAALAIFLSVTDGQFLLYLRRADNALTDFLHVFEYTAQLSIIGLVVTTLSLVAMTTPWVHSLPLSAKLIGSFPMHFFFAYSLTSCFSLITTVVAFTNYKVDFQQEQEERVAGGARVQRLHSSG